MEFEVFEAFVGEGLGVFHDVAAAAFDSGEELVLLHRDLRFGDSLGWGRGVGFGGGVGDGVFVFLEAAHCVCAWFWCGGGFVVLEEGECLWGDGDSCFGCTGLW